MTQIYIDICEVIPCMALISLFGKRSFLFEYQVKIIFLAFLSGNTYTIFNRMVNTFISINVSEVILC